MGRTEWREKENKVWVRQFPAKISAWENPGDVTIL